MKRWLVIVIIAAALVVVGGMGWIGYKSSQAQATPPSVPPTTVATVCDVEQTIDSPGSVVNTRVISIQMPTAGSLADILVSPGDHVSSGQVLAHLSDPDRCLRPWQMRTFCYCRPNALCKMSPTRPRSRRPRPTRPW